jgi:hypothetical protein
LNGKRGAAFQEIGMKDLKGFVILIGASLLVGCATLTPEDYGFQRVAMSGQEKYCAPREWVVPPVVPQESANDPNFPLYEKFLTLPYTNVVSDAHPPTPEVCITQAQWPQWLMVRIQWKGNWPLTPGMAETLAAQRVAGS